MAVLRFAAVRVFFPLLCLLCLWGHPSLLRADDTGLEYKLKAGFLVNFARFTTWPASAWAGASPSLNLCILGVDPFGPALAGVEEKQVAGHPIALRHTDTVPSTVGACHLLFVSRSEAARQDRILAATAVLPVVTVSDIPGFAASGGVFEFRNRDGRLAFVINNTRARASGIQVSASLLDLALEVL